MQKFKETRKKVLKMLPGFVKQNGIDILSFIRVVDYETETDLNDEAIEDLLTASLIKEPIDGKCHFFKDNRAYIIKDETTGVVTYWSVNYKKGERFHLLLHDFFIILEGGNYGLGITRMLKAYGYQTKEESIIEDYRGKYERNVEKIKDKNIWESYTFLYDNVKTVLPVLETINKIGKINVMRARHNINGEHVFFLSMRYLAKIIAQNNEGKTKNTTGAKEAINMLCLLGLIEKAKLEELPDDIKLKCFPLEDNHENRKKQSRMTQNFYMVKELTEERLKEAEEKLEKIEEIYRRVRNSGSKKEAIKLTKKSLTRDRVKQYFGEKEARRVFPNNEEETKRAIAGKNKRRKDKALVQSQPQLPLNF